MSKKDNALRFNQNKVDLTLLPAEACEQECRVWMMGEKKYGRYNWKKLWGPKTVEVAMASLLRHAFAILEGEVNDEESGLDHAAHIRCNAAMILEYRKLQIDQADENNLKPETSQPEEGKELDDDGAEIVERYEDGGYLVTAKHNYMGNSYYFREVRDTCDDKKPGGEDTEGRPMCNIPNCS